MGSCVLLAVKSGTASGHFTHALALECQPVRVMHEPIEDRVGDGRIAELGSSKSCYLTAPRKSAGDAGILALIYIKDGVAGDSTMTVRVDVPVLPAWSVAT
jgi:hypothetical protein